MVSCLVLGIMAFCLNASADPPRLLGSPFYQIPEKVDAADTFSIALPFYDQDGDTILFTIVNATEDAFSIDNQGKTLCI